MNAITAIKNDCIALKQTDRDIKIIVTLTSFPARIKTVAETLIPIFKQTMQPDKVILWLAEEQFKHKERNLPKDLLLLKEYGLEIKWCKDLKSHKKYYYTLKENPDAILITIDDDIVYSEDLVQKLYASYEKNPDAVSAMRVHKMIFDDEGLPRSYDCWVKEYPANISSPRYDLMPTGAGGILYPPHCFSNLVADLDGIKVCINGDDLWLKCMSIINDTPVVLAAKQARLNYVENTQEYSLYSSNVDNNQNDVQLKNILSYLKEKYSVTDIFRKAIAESDYLYEDHQPKVSIVMPIYNVQDYLAAALDSVLNQTLHDIEVICVNDGSTDNSLNILKEYQERDSRITIIDKENSGYGDSMNVGIYSAKGKYIGIVETDDFVLPDMFMTLYCIAAEKNLDLIKGDIIQFYGDGEERTTKYISIAGKNPDYYNKVVNITEDYTPLYFTMNTWAGIYKRKFITSHKIRHNPTPGASYQDSGFWFQTFIWATRAFFINRPFYMYRQDNPNSSINNPDKVYCVNHEYDYIYRILERYPEKKKYFMDIFVYRRYYSYMFALSKMGEKYKYNFLKRFRSDFKKHQENQEINSSLFTIGEYGKLKAIISNPARYYAENIYDGKKLPINDIEVKYEVEKIKNKENEKELNFYKSSKYYKKFVKRNIKLHRKVKFKELYNKGIKYFRNHGFIEAVKRAFVEIKKISEDNKHEKMVDNAKKDNNKLKILFIASDNSPSSGAFLSMTILSWKLKTKYNAEPFVILPCSGRGGFLLDEYGIGHKTIKSENWVISLEEIDKKETKNEISYQKKENDAAVNELVKFIADNKFDIVHINTTYSYVGAIAAHKAKVPLVWHLREFLEEDQGKTLWNRKKGNKLINKSDRVVAISNGLYEKYSAFIDSKRLVRIYNGIDSERFYCKREIFTNEKVIFVIIGGFALYKGHVEFANALIELHKRGIKNFEAWFIGTGNPKVRKQVEDMFDENGMTDNYKILGYIKDVETYLKQTDISFTCAKSEAFGRTTVEAMMAGNLVIGANTAGTKELVLNGKIGLEYQSGNPVDLADKIEYALNNREKMQELALAGQDYMINNMTADLNAENIYALYNEILKKD